MLGGIPRPSSRRSIAIWLTAMSASRISTTTKNDLQGNQLKGDVLNEMVDLDDGPAEAEEDRGNRRVKGSKKSLR